MRLLVLLTLVVFTAAASIPGLKVIRTDNFGDYNFGGKMVFTGTIHGVQTQLNGTAESIYAQFTAQNPDVVADYKAHNAHNPHDGTFNASVKEPRDLERRNKLLPPLCNPPGQPWSPAQQYWLKDAIYFLRNLNGGCGVGAGPGNCVRLTCLPNAATFLCNDNPYPIAPACPYLSSYIDDIVMHCSKTPYGPHGLVLGQEFDTDSYNVVVRADWC